MDNTSIIYGPATGTCRHDIIETANSGKETVFNIENVFSISDGSDKKKHGSHLA